MKKIFSILVFGVGLMLFSCGDVFDLDLQDDPNSPTPETADLESLYNSVQLSFEDVVMGPDGFSRMQDFTMQLSRQRAFTAGGIYETSFNPPFFNNIWTWAYANFLPDVDAVIARASETQQNIHVGSAKVMKAYVLMSLVDVFVNIPYSEAGQGLEALSPNSQDGQSVYEAAKGLLTEAVADLEANTAAGPRADNMYGGSAAGWLAAANTLLLRSAVYTRDNATFNSIIEGGNYITDSSLDWQFEYSSNRANPDSRHPLYTDSYEVDDGHYMSNWLMWAMNDEKGVKDPRIRAYFYRQVSAVPLDNANIFDCIFSVLPEESSRPAHYSACGSDMPYCVASISDGYYGRDHGNGNGIPPDGPVRTVYGVYPAGGKFDADTYKDVRNDGTDGALGAGIHPLLPSFFVNFYQAEMAAMNGDDAAAKDHLMAGIAASVGKVKGFINRDANSLDEVVSTDINTGAEIKGAAFVPSADQDTAYYDVVSEIYDNSSDKLDVIAKEFLIATFGNGLEGYNLIRRTARPRAIQPMIEVSAGAFIRSGLYPANHVDRNQNANQKSILDQVFWDTNPAELGSCL